MVSSARLPVLGVLAALIVAGCGAATTGQVTQTAPPSQATTAVALGPPCDPAAPQGAAAGYPGWPAPGKIQATSTRPILPILASSELVPGPNRLVFNIVDPTNQPLAAPDVAVELAFYDLAADPAKPVAIVSGVPLDTGTGRWLYRAAVDFSCSGRWGLEVTAHLPARPVAVASGGPAGASASPAGSVSPGASPAVVVSQARVTFDVLPYGSTPAIGAPAPLSDSLTATTLEGVAAISSDKSPDPALYRLTVAQAVKSGKPAVIAFATPAFCQTAMCGPVLDHVKAAAADYRDRVDFVNVEPYKLQMTPNGLQPVLDADGHLQPVQSVIDYGLRSEPFVFVVDAQGRVTAKLDGAIDESELRADLDAVL